MILDLREGRFLRRYQRFFADVELPDEGVVTAHCPNTGSMATLLESGCRAWVKPASDPKRRLKWTLTLLETKDGGVALVDTSLPNRLVEEALVCRLIPELAGYSTIRREAAYGADGRSRIDLLLEDSTRERCWVEIKNVTMADQRHATAAFPDARTTRGRKHLDELSARVRAGERAVMFYLVSRSAARTCRLAADIDPDYKMAAEEARHTGVEFQARRLVWNSPEIQVGETVPFCWD